LGFAVRASTVPAPWHRDLTGLLRSTRECSRWADQLMDRLNC
jgi:hypothetical protein